MEKKPNGFDQHSDGRRYRAFLSYSSKDRKLAEWLHKKLEHYRIPRRLVNKPSALGRIPSRVSPIFRDRDDARSGNDVDKSISKYLAESQQLIVLCTPSAASPESWVGREILSFQRVRPGGQIHAIIGGGEPPKCFPEPLFTLNTDGSSHAPLAADLRERKTGGDGRRKAVIKLLAGLVGVEFDELWRREQRRRFVRISLLTIFIGGMLAAGGIWIRQLEIARLAGIEKAAKKIDPDLHGDTADLMMIAAGPPAFGAIVRADPLQIEGLRAITRRIRPSYAGFISQLHQDLNTDLVALSEDGRFAFSKSTADAGLFVWDVQRNRLVARLPLDTTDWLRMEADLNFEERFKPLAINVANNGYTIVAVYADAEGPSRLVALWKLNSEGSCTPPCLPERFRFSLPPGAHTWMERISMDHPAKLELSLDAARLLYVEVGSKPQQIDVVNRRIIQPGPKSGASCKLTIPDPPAPKKKASEFAGFNLPIEWDEKEDIVWLDKDGQSVARMLFDQQTTIFYLAFYYGLGAKEVARLKLPKNTTNIGDSNVDVVFLDHGSRALIARTRPDTDDDLAVQIYGIVDLRNCYFDAWPPTDLESFVAKHVVSVSGEKLTVNSVQGYHVSNDEHYAAGVLNLSGDENLMVVVIYNIDDRHPIAFFDPRQTASDVGEIQSVIPSANKEYPFEVLTSSARVLIRTDGTTGHTTQFNDGEHYATRRTPEPAWEWSNSYGSQPNQWRFVDRKTDKPSRPLDFYGDTIGSVAVSRAGEFLALAQSDVIFVQPANTGALGKTLRLKVSGVQKLQFSIDGRMLGILSNPEGKDDAPTIIQVWNVATGEMVHQRRSDPKARLLAVNDDGSVIMETSGAATWLDLGNGSSRPLFKAQRAQLVARQADILGADGYGNLWSIDRNLKVKPLKSVKLLKGKNLVAASLDDQLAYVSDFDSDYFLNLNNGTAQEFLRTPTGASVFAINGQFAIVAYSRQESEIQIWNPINAARLASYHGDWKNVLAIWFSEDDRDLWALDDRGRLHRWALKTEYATDVASACLALRDSSARTEFTDAELASVPQLGPADKEPCLRFGPLSSRYYTAFLRQMWDNISGKGAAFGSLDCTKRKKLNEVTNCKKVFENRWKALEEVVKLNR